MNPQARLTAAEIIALTTEVLGSLDDLERGVVPNRVAALVAASPALRERVDRARARQEAQATDAPDAVSGAPDEDPGVSRPGAHYELLGAHVTWRDEIASVRGEVEHRDGGDAAGEYLALHMTVRVSPAGACVGDAESPVGDGDAHARPAWQVETLSLRPAAGAQRRPM
ncbi:hypothetical protein BSZ39_00100 [Bowdeniella nasicola]|uniref:Uncharacterized protein n=1 Tax=Bowdeniella nasicola TaxID=208480 RepID=A0A1Q5Q606_9ACTO|nr:hypothetical protein [Bowdeniella nasicola]OKL55142.1 hypothetical protein BSZ39_00100 [Bowdeniella nasicola]